MESLVEHVAAENVPRQIGPVLGQKGAPANVARHAPHDRLVTVGKMALQSHAIIGHEWAQMAQMSFFSRDVVPPVQPKLVIVIKLAAARVALKGASTGLRGRVERQ